MDSSERPRSAMSRLMRLRILKSRQRRCPDAQLRRRDGSDIRDNPTLGYASPAPFVTIEIRAAVGRSLLLKTQTMQWYARAIEKREGAKPFAVAWFAERIQALFEQRLQNQIERREIVDELLARLKEVRPGKQDLIDPMREDRISFEAQAYAELLLMRKEPNALPQFRRLSLTAYARKLEVALAEDPKGGQWLSDIIVALDDLVVQPAPVALLH